jgi:hypothetical protein
VQPAEAPLPEVALPESPLAAEQPADDGCAVVVDIARDGRRFAGPRAAAVVRSVAELVADQLPSGARSRFGDSDALVVTRAGWSRADATGWMYRTLPALLDGFVVAEELPGAQLRVAVHDAGGPVGAQLLQPLTDTRAPSADLTTSASEERGQKFRAARAERREHGSRARRSEAADDTDHEGDAQRWPFSGDTHAADVEALLRDEDVPSGGRHGSGGARSAGPERGDTGGRGRRHRADDTGDQAGDALRRTDHTPARAADEPQQTLVGTGRAARRRGAENAADGSAGSGSAGSGSAANGSATGGSVGNGSTGNGSAGDGSAGSAGNGSGGSWAAGTGSSGSRSGSNGAASSNSVTSDSVADGAVANGAVANGAVANGAGSNGAGSNGAGSNGAAGGSTSAAAEPERAESTEGLGIADLLAGALAAYRGI